MGSQSTEQTKNRSPGTYLVDTFNHSLCRELDFEVQIPALYVQERLSLKQISARLGVSRDLVRETLKRAKVKVQSTRRALDMTGQTPFGWKREKGRLVPHVAEQKLIARMVEGRRSKLSLHAIARAFSAENVQTKNGGRWHAKSISQILECNARLMGVYLTQSNNEKRD
ncbi:recombinase family protein [Bdellovibrionota bacterium FG-1]